MTQPLERGVPHSPEIKLVSQMTPSDFESLAKTSGGNAGRHSTIDSHIAEIEWPSLRSRINFTKADPNVSDSVDSLMFLNWGKNGHPLFLENCAIVSDRKSTSFVAAQKLGPVYEIVEVVTLTPANGEVAYSKIQLRVRGVKLKPNIRKAFSLIQVQDAPAKLAS